MINSYDPVYDCNGVEKSIFDKKPLFGSSLRLSHLEMIRFHQHIGEKYTIQYTKLS